MVNKKNWFGMLVMVLVFGFFLNGCGEIDGGGYTFEFKVKNSDNIQGRTITQIEIFNGSSQSAPVLLTETMNLTYNELSGVYKVSGFTQKDGDSKCFFGVRMTLGNGTTYWDYRSRENKNSCQFF